MRRAFAGHGASRGSALGRARVRQPLQTATTEPHIAAGQVESEIERLHQAIAIVREALGRLRERLQGALSQEIGEFINLHALLLDDPELLHGLDGLIRNQHYSADHALRLQRDRLAAVFEEMDDAYFRSRIDDLDQVVNRVRAALYKQEAELQGLAGDILITDNVAPSELAELQSQGVLAIVTTAGSLLSHSAILARSLHLPLVVGVADILQQVREGDVVAVDGQAGHVVLEPNPGDLRAHRDRLRDGKRETKQLHRLRREPTRTLDGTDIKLFANAESREDVAEAHALGCAGVGLYRTEFLFMQRDTLPDEREQFQAYRNALLGMTGRAVTIRTMDLGADKADRTGLVETRESNPALGLRGVRLSLARPEVFRTQLRAIVRASGYGPVRVLVPMVAERSELVAVAALLKSVARDLRSEGHEIAEHIPLGAMIEVPAAAISLPTFIDVVDFISVGTNDLAQYVLAADRGNEALGELYTPLHPAMLRLLRDIVRTANARGKPVCICGEMARDASFAPLLLALGITELSLHPATMLEVRRAIRSLNLGVLKARTPGLLRARDRSAIERWLESVQPATTVVASHP